MKYKIEVHANGYEDLTVLVEASSLRQAKQSELKAKVQWADHNALDMDDSSWEMPFTRTTKVAV